MARPENAVTARMNAAMLPGLWRLWLSPVAVFRYAIGHFRATQSSKTQRLNNGHQIGEACLFELHCQCILVQAFALESCHADLKG